MSDTQNPVISVVLPVYNGGKYLEAAIDSILSQTYENFEVIAINDGSTDDSTSIIQSFADNRIKFFDQKNMGLAATLNRAIRLANGRYIARQDADDLSLPTRFEKQVAFLEANPAYGMVGTWATIWEETRETDRAHRHPPDDLTLKFDLLFDNPFVHSSVMIAKRVIDTVGLYATDESRQPPEDYELWSRIARRFKVANIPEILQIYREVPTSVCRSATFVEKTVNISIENIAALTGRDAHDEHVINISAFSHNAFGRISKRLSFRAMWLILLEAADALSGSSADRHYLRKRAGRVFRLFLLRYLVIRYGRIISRMRMGANRPSLRPSVKSRSRDIASYFSGLM